MLMLHSLMGCCLHKASSRLMMWGVVWVDTQRQFSTLLSGFMHTKFKLYTLLDTIAYNPTLISEVPYQSTTRIMPLEIILFFC